MGHFDAKFREGVTSIISSAWTVILNLKTCVYRLVRPEELQPRPQGCGLRILSIYACCGVGSQPHQLLIWRAVVAFPLCAPAKYVHAGIEGRPGSLWTCIVSTQSAA